MKKKITISVAVVILIVVAVFIFWKEVKAPTNETAITTPTPTPTPVATPNPTPIVVPPPSVTPNPDPVAPPPVSPSTTGIVDGTADTSTLHINKIVIYKSDGKTEVTSSTLDSFGNFSISLTPGNYMIDYAANPDFYPHEPEAIQVVAGKTHEVDFSVETQ